MSNATTLRLYRTILRLGRKWEALDPTATATERRFIQGEAKTLFRANKKVSDPAALQACHREAEERIELALHYHNPYPRMPCVGPGAVSKAKKLQKRQERLRQQSMPSYLRSYNLDTSSSS